MLRKEDKIFHVWSAVNNFIIYCPFYKALSNDYSTEIQEYRVDSYTYDNFPIGWYYPNRREPLIPYEKGIKDYEMSKNDNYVDFTKSYIDEAFSEEEAKALLLFLNRFPEVGTEMKEIDLPIEEVLAPPSLIGTGGGDYEFTLARTYDYREHDCGRFTPHWTLPFDASDLPFDVIGYFSLMDVSYHGAVLRDHKQRNVTDTKELRNLAREYEKTVSNVRREKWNL